MIIDFEVVLREFSGLADLTRTQIFFIYELTKIIIVSKNKNLIFAIFQIVVQDSKDLNNGE